MRPPAVYRYFDANGLLLYVGCSTAARKRLREHANYRPWFADVRRIEIINFETPELAREAELAAICTENPRYNVVGNPRIKRESKVNATEATMPLKDRELNRRYCQAWRDRNRKAYNAYLRTYRARKRINPSPTPARASQAR